MKKCCRAGFTLIELSIVLVIVGLIVGGVLAGRNLIIAAGARSQISQIEKYQTAARTFQGKYGYLPGDITAQAASSFGFATRSSEAWLGNDLIDGTHNNIGGDNGWFWADLSVAGLIDGGYPVYVLFSDTPLTYFPESKLGSGNYMNAFSGGVFNDDPSAYDTVYGRYDNNVGKDGKNYLTIVPGNYLHCCGAPTGSSRPVMSVAMARNIDAKMDDGLPQSGRVIAAYWQGVGGTGPSGCCVAVSWSGPNTNYSPTNSGPTATAIAGDATTCYDNGNSAGAIQQYSINQNAGAGVNCGLSFRY